VTNTTDAEIVRWGEIDGREITLPMHVAAFDAATLLFTVDAAAAQALLPGDAFEVIETDGSAQFVVALVDYVDNPWGDYLEINLGFLARPRGASPDVVGSFVYRMPVDQAFTCAAGNQVMGFPKTVEDLRRVDEDGTVRFEWWQAGALVMAFELTPPAEVGAPMPVESVSYSYLDGVATETPLTLETGSGLVDAATVEVDLGQGPAADELRTLGLPAVPDLAMWGTGLQGWFSAPRPAGS
jgi:hypothetical protein